MKHNLSAVALLLAAGAATAPLSRGAADRQQCLDFLYASMLTADSVDHPRSYYERNVDLALEARRTMPWGESVPEREWLHFVLPVRVNNEDLDTCRGVFLREIGPRVKGMSMHDAALEVNHWCHEKVTYRPSDARTSSPLASVRTSWGRCGEESTLAVAALRSVGIPARQVYTPRWAHTDDNHAWVEVWVDGKWHFLGACEPEAMLDLGWFNAPAARGMMMNTTVYGPYDGPEEVLTADEISTTINVTSNYAPTATATVTVTDEVGRPVPGATVRFCLYNYAEFYPIALRVADTAGRATLSTGLGDMVVWASDSLGRFNYEPLRVGEAGGELTLPLLPPDKVKPVKEFTLVPPGPSGSLPVPEAAAAALNARRLSHEDSVRNAYMATFFTPDSGALWARENGWENPDEIGRLLADSYGNHQVITDFLSGAPDRAKAMALLKALSAKDLRDITAEVLADHYAASMPRGVADETFALYVMNPRVASEGLTPWRKFFADSVLASLGALDADQWQQWVSRNVEVGTGSRSASRKPIYTSPQGVWKHPRGVAARSRDLFYVAGMRSLGIPARVNPVTNRPQRLAPDGQEWLDVVFEAQEEPAPKGILALDYEPTRWVDDPKYYAQFSLSQIDAEGVPHLMNYDDFEPWSRTFKQGVQVDAGRQLLVSGQRMADGSVLARAALVEVPAGQRVHTPLVLRQDTLGVQVIGTFNAENLYRPADEGAEPRSLLGANGRGYYVLGLLRPNHEPSSHALNDLSGQREALEKWGHKIFLIYPDQEALQRARLADFASLPSTAEAGTDTGGAMEAELRGQFAHLLHGTQADMPLFIVADTFNRVVFLSNGYNIDLGRKLLDVLNRAE